MRYEGLFINYCNSYHEIKQLAALFYGYILLSLVKFTPKLVSFTKTLFCIIILNIVEV